MMFVILLLVSLGLALVLSLFGGGFEIRKPAITLSVAGVLGALFSVAVVTLSDNGPYAILALLGPIVCLIAVVGLLSLAILWAYRRWSGFHEER